MQLVSPDVSLFSNASTLVWGASVLQASVSGLWTQQEQSFHINLLELRAIGLSLSHFTEDFCRKAVAVFSDNATFLAYARKRHVFWPKEGGTCSRVLNAEAQSVLQWVEDHAIQIIPQFVKGSSNVLADCLSRRDQVISTKWMLHQDVCSQLWRT